MTKNSSEVTGGLTDDLSDASDPFSSSDHSSRDVAAIDAFEKIHDADGSIVVLFQEGRGMIDVDAHLPAHDEDLGSGPPGVGDSFDAETVDVVVELLASRNGKSRLEYFVDGLAGECELSREEILEQIS